MDKNGAAGAAAAALPSPALSGTRAALGSRLFYGWVIVAVGALGGAATIGVVQAFSVFLPHLQEGLGASRATLSLAFSLQMLIYGASSILAGALADRFGTRRLVATGGILYGVGLLLAARSQTAWALALAFGGVGGLGMGALLGPLQYLTARWFDRRKGMALGFLLAGPGLGTLLVSPLAAALIGWQGWRGTFVALGIGAAAVILGTCPLLLEDPSACGLRPDGAAATALAEEPAPAVSPWTSATAMRTPAFWLLQGTFLACCGSHAGPLVHGAAHAVDVGVSSAWAAGMMSAFGISSFAGRIGFGAVADRIGGRATLVGSLAAQMVLVAVLGGLQDRWAFMTFSVFFGLAYGGVFAQYPVILREYFGATRVGAVYGTTLFVGSLGMALGPYLAGLIHDVTGTYQVPFWVNGGIGAAALLLALGLSRPTPPGPAAAAAAECPMTNDQ
jgi:MFS family permease